jgi:hypothetical protein
MLWLSGHPDGPPLWPVAGMMDGLHHSVRRISSASASSGHRITPELRPLLAGRAALMGLTRRGRTSPGGACRLLATTDGWVALSLSRPGDADLVPAITGAEPGGDPWSALHRAAGSLRSRDVADRAQLVGVPAAALTPLAPLAGGADPESVALTGGVRAAPSAGRPPLVVDLSALWAGPLCGKLLGDAGARVVKVESRNRPDGARAGCTDFFDWLHAGHESVVLDFARRNDLSALHALIAEADVVIEASRPRALAALGVDAERVVGSVPGKVWLSITGYGRHGAAADRVAFGDDAGVAAGQVAWDANGRPVFCGDALGDPVAGLEAARAVLESRARGGGELISLSMVDAVRSVARPLPPAAVPVRGGRPDADDWIVEIGGSVVDIERPAPPSPASPAPAFGAHTRAVIDGLGSERSD